MEFPCWLSRKESACNTGDTNLILGQESPLEKEMATYFSIFAWEIPWTEEPVITGGLKSMGLQKSQTQLRDYTYKRIIQSNIQIYQKKKKKKNPESKVIHRDPHLVSRFSQSGNMAHVPMYLSTIKLYLQHCKKKKYKLNQDSKKVNIGNNLLARNSGT